MATAVTRSNLGLHKPVLTALIALAGGLCLKVVTRETSRDYPGSAEFGAGGVTLLKVDPGQGLEEWRVAN